MVGAEASAADQAGEGGQGAGGVLEVIVIALAGSSPQSQPTTA